MPESERPSRRLSPWWAVVVAVLVLAAGGVLAVRHRRASQLPSSFADECLALGHAECDWNDRCLGHVRSGVVAAAYGADHAGCLRMWRGFCAAGHWCEEKSGKDVPVHVSPAEAAATTRYVAHKTVCSSLDRTTDPGICVTGSGGGPLHNP